MVENGEKDVLAMEESSKRQKVETIEIDDKPAPAKPKPVQAKKPVQKPVVAARV